MMYFAPAIVIFMAAVTGPDAAQAQTVYRCGSTYSQTPCDKGISLDVQDPRSALQKTQADAAIKKEKATADAMEKDRLRQEAAAQRNNRSNALVPDKKAATRELYTPPPASSKSVEVSSRIEASAKVDTPKKKKTKEPEYFTAQSSPENKKKPAVKPQ